MRIIGMIIAALLILAFSVYKYGTSFSETITVTDKERMTSGSDEDISYWYIVFAKDQEGKPLEFKNVDSWFHLKFRSSTVQNKLEVGKTYRIHAYGWRWGFPTIYPNIVSVE